MVTEPYESVGLLYQTLERNQKRKGHRTLRICRAAVFKVVTGSRYNRHRTLRICRAAVFKL